MPSHQLDNDPPPVPPVRPENGDCCNGGCDRCVFDLYADAVERYEAELRGWQQRQMKDGLQI